MTRRLKELTQRHYDVVIVGGGIYGACIAWDAALRGLLVCLVEKSDFGSGTSANSLKIIHGGLRYIQHGNLKAMRELIRERRTWMRIAPHLIHPLPVLVPTYGRWLKKLLAAAVMLHDLLGADQNKIDDPEKHIPRGQTVSKSQCLEIVPDVPTEELTGGIVFHDAQVYNTERLVLSFLRSAVKAGAVVANYVEAIGLLTSANRVLGVQVNDIATGDRFDIRGKAVVSACGPWLDSLLPRGNAGPGKITGYAKAINIVTRPLVRKYALGISGDNGYKSADALTANRTPLLFITPWRNRCLIGTRYTPYEGRPSDLKITERDVRTFLDGINLSWPAARLRFEDVSFVHGGLLPTLATSSNDRIELSNKYKIVHHRGEEKTGLFSVMSNKYTTARLAAEKVVDTIFKTNHQQPPRSRTFMVPVHGGQIDAFDTFVRSEVERQPHGLSAQTLRRLIYNYGSAYSEVLHYLEPRDGSQSLDEDFAVLRAEAIHGAREEMARKLSDVVFRRTELGSAGHPGDEALRVCASAMSAELGWSPERTRAEIEETSQAFRFGGCHSITT